MAKKSYSKNKLLKILRQGPEVWNAWRKENPEVEINLSGAKLRGVRLRGADLSNAVIRGVNFSEADLTDANFVGAQCGLPKQRYFLHLILLIYWLFFASILAAFNGWVFVAPFLNSTPSIGGLVGLVVVVSFFVISIRKGILSGFSLLFSSAGVIAATTLAMAIVAAIAGTLLRPVALIGFGALSATIAATVVSALALALTGVGVLADNRYFAAALIATSGVSIVAALVIALLVARAGGVVIGSVVSAVAGTVGVSLAFVLFSAVIAWRALRGEKQNLVVTRSAMAFAYIGGTTFRQANLTNALFSNAHLKGSDFSDAILERTRFRDSKYSERARWGGTILSSLEVRNLVVSGRGADKSFAKADLTGANLVDANLERSNLEGAVLINATVRSACLENANLSNTQCMGTDFTEAHLTGACLDGWSLYAETDFKGIQCEHIYLKKHKKGSNFTERRPHDPHATFKSGEFEALIRKQQDTIDLVFVDGIDWQAFFQSFQELRDKYRDNDLAIQAIESKGQGVFVVRLETSADLEVQGTIEASAKEFYDHNIRLLEAQVANYEKLIESEKREKSKLMGIVETMAENQASKVVQNINAPVTGLAGIVEGDMNIFTTEQQKSMADTAKEIQDLLNQLSETYSPVEVPAQADAEIQKRPTLRKKLVGAIKAGGKKAIEKLVDHPAAAIVLAAAEGWDKGK